MAGREEGERDATMRPRPAGSEAMPGPAPFAVRAWLYAFDRRVRRKIASYFVSVRAKVVSLLTLVGAVLIALSGGFALYDFKHDLRVQSDIRAAAVSDIFIHAAHRALDLEEMEPVLAALTGVATIKGAAVAGPDGRIIMASPSTWIGGNLGAAAAALPDKGTSGKPVAIEAQRYLAGSGAHPGDYAIRLDFPQIGTSGVALVRVDTDIIASQLVVVAVNTLMWLTITIILAILTISLLIHRVVVAPIEALRSYAESGGEGVADAAGPDDEIGIVARALSDSFQAKHDGEDRLVKLSWTDGLTGLGNRGFFKRRLAEEIACCESDETLIGVLIMNLDQFKDVNDTLGHDAGDAVLKRTAKILTGCRRDGDTVARIGGDEFGIVLRDIRDADEALELASRLVRAIGAPFRLGRQELQQAACVGLTFCPRDGRDVDSLMKNADLALSRAKQEGAGACVLYRHELHLRAIERNSIERDLRAAIAKRELMLFYQPKIDAVTGRMTGAEALIRWRHEERGFISPAVFIPVAERCGLIVPLTKWVLDEACRQNREWQVQGLPKISIAVNVSAIDLRRTDLTDTIANTLIERELSPQYLELEITESMVMQDVDVVIGTLRRLRSLGVSISIDDFGTGYSSLAYLKRFPVKRLKIDRSFICDVADKRDGTVIPKVIIDLAHALGMTVIAEGVETANQHNILRDLGCDEIQGYFTGRPMPAAEFEVFLRNSPAGKPDSNDRMPPRAAAGASIADLRGSAA